LVWMRCSLGQTWDGKICTSEAKKYTWLGALVVADTFNSSGGFGGYTDWVVPHIEDLSTIRYCSGGFEGKKIIPTKLGKTKAIDEGCKGHNYQQPTINQDIFPNTKRDGGHWSSSVLSNSVFAQAWVVYFNNGYGSGRDKHYRNYVRLVRPSH